MQLHISSVPGLLLWSSLIIAFSASCTFVKTKKAADVSRSYNTVAIPVKAEEDPVDTLLFIKDTTFAIGNYKLAFQKIDSIPIADIYTDAEDRAMLMSQYDNFYAGAKAVENYLKNTQGHYFKRTADTLFLKLENGNDLPHVNRNSESDDVEGYTYENYFPQLNAYLIRVQYYEGHRYLLVDRKSGTQKIIIGAIYPSPSGKQLLSVNEDIEAGYSNNGFQLVSRKGDEFKTLFSIEAGNWAPIGVKWLEENSLVIKAMIMREDYTDFTLEYYKLTYR